MAKRRSPSPRATPSLPDFDDDGGRLSQLDFASPPGGTGGSHHGRSSDKRGRKRRTFAKSVEQRRSIRRQRRAVASAEVRRTAGGADGDGAMSIGREGGAEADGVEKNANAGIIRGAENENDGDDILDGVDAKRTLEFDDDEKGEVEPLPDDEDGDDFGGSSADFRVEEEDAAMKNDKSTKNDDEDEAMDEDGGFDGLCTQALGSGGDEENMNQEEAAPSDGAKPVVSVENRTDTRAKDGDDVRAKEKDAAGEEGSRSMMPIAGGKSTDTLTQAEVEMSQNLGGLFRDLREAKDEISRLNDTIDRLKREEARKVAELNGKIASLRREGDASLAELENKTKDDIASLKAEHAAELRGRDELIEKNRIATEQTVRRINAKHEAEIEELRNQHAAQVEAGEARHGNEIAKMREERESELRELGRERAAAVEGAQRATAAAVADRYVVEASELKARHADELRTVADRHKAEVEATKREQAARVKEAVDDATRKLNDIHRAAMTSYWDSFTS